MTSWTRLIPHGSARAAKVAEHSIHAATRTKNKRATLQVGILILFPARWRMRASNDENDSSSGQKRPRPVEEVFDESGESPQGDKCPRQVSSLPRRGGSLPVAAVAMDDKNLQNKPGAQDRAVVTEEKKPREALDAEERHAETYKALQEQHFLSAEIYGGLDLSDIPLDVPLVPAAYGNVPYAGVKYSPGLGWEASIQIDGNHKYLGSFATPKHAALVYSRAHYKLHRGSADIYQGIDLSVVPKDVPIVPTVDETGMTGYVGVTVADYHIEPRIWQASVNCAGSLIPLGEFFSKEKAARVAARAMFFLGMHPDQIGTNEVHGGYNLCAVPDDVPLLSVTRKQRPDTYKEAVYLKDGSWHAHITDEGKQKYLGSFETEDEALRVVARVLYLLGQHPQQLERQPRDGQQEMKSSYISPEKTSPGTTADEDTPATEHPEGELQPTSDMDGVQALRQPKAKASLREIVLGRRSLPFQSTPAAKKKEEKKKDSEKPVALSDQQPPSTPLAKNEADDKHDSDKPMAHSNQKPQSTPVVEKKKEKSEKNVVHSGKRSSKHRALSVNIIRPGDTLAEFVQKRSSARRADTEVKTMGNQLRTPRKLPFSQR